MKTEVWEGKSYHEEIMDGTPVWIQDLPEVEELDPLSFYPEGYGRSSFRKMRERYLESKYPEWYLMPPQKELYEDLAKTDVAAQKLFKALLPDFLKSNGVTEELKRKDLMEWWGLYNLSRKQAEEVVQERVIFV